ncbi:hypothetical protein HRI_000063400 [Hibiscus trionum]|uniref:Two-component response regulator-like APRR2 n=1 Tax=Hibiscus trionum TaxID=183268 RepID=A0A9W7GTS1_HIBTR|nr:hypothetical protein HRI_000063400 [Hibiscus trionum]
MVCTATANDLSAWKDFPKGLRVLLLDEDTKSAAEIKSKLESMDYIVYTFCNENEALSAVSSRPESFHVAIIEVSTINNNGSFKFLETAKDLPTIMASNVHCISTMMKCIALGAVEFLRKPPSEDKLRDIWQHVVHKVDWTPELHTKFVQAVDELGIDQAIPSRILKLMKVEGLTRHNVASHLQKYRMHRRHILPKEDGRKWLQRHKMQSYMYTNKPITAFPPYHSNYVISVGPLYPMWGAGARAPSHPPSIQMWGVQGYYSPWQPTEGWHSKLYTGVSLSLYAIPSFQQNPTGFHCSCAMDQRRNCVEHHPEEEVIERTVREAMSKLWLPLPLGLKPELSRRGISTIDASCSC